MKAAGIDGTDLFDQVHRWVNYESMLKECLVGRMATKASTAIKGAQISTDKQSSPVNGLTPTLPALVPELPAPPSKAPPPPKDHRPRFDWFQTEAMVNVVVYTKRKIPNSDCALVDLQGGALRVEVLLGKLSYLLHLRLSQEVEESVSVHTVTAVGKVQVSLRKAARAKWDKLGEPLQSHDSFLRRKDRGEFFRDCTLVSKTDVTHDTRLFCFRLPSGTHMRVPVGRHVYLKAPIQGNEVVKPYTPVDRTLMPVTPDSPESEHTDVFLMIKIYPTECSPLTWTAGASVTACASVVQRAPSASDSYMRSPTCSCWLLGPASPPWPDSSDWPCWTWALLEKSQADVFQPAREGHPLAV
ncbi:hypothetical protein AGOR_G00205320 [Albula goreensis]|uniref:CS domain-containing protein n=1 Tax=Albula goreensis TaxID=1534307 RepID=A0A8T3CSD2_9TELE|nr:hypothetical protein AGOR_G00205320 [Albula goreensis]